MWVVDTDDLEELDIAKHVHGRAWLLVKLHLMIETWKIPHCAECKCKLLNVGIRCVMLSAFFFVSKAESMDLVQYIANYLLHFETISDQ